MAGRYLIGAYAALPSTGVGNAALEASLLRALGEAGFVGGLEAPYSGPRPHDPDWLVRQVRPGWSCVLTCIPGTMAKLAANPAFGLASSDPEGRRLAIEFHAAARDAVGHLHRALGRVAVTTVELHSAPRPTGGVWPTREALRLSLDELRSWDWEGAALAVEHCDRAVAGRTPAKGFLSLEEEIAALTESRGRTSAGVAINWGRSAIDERDADGPRRHVLRAREAGLLRGLVFSGAAVADELYGDWEDSHAPFATESSDSRWLLTPARARACLAAAGVTSLEFLGLKIQPLPTTLGVAERVAVLARAARILDEAAQQA